MKKKAVVIAMAAALAVSQYASVFAANSPGTGVVIPSDDDDDDYDEDEDETPAKRASKPAAKKAASKKSSSSVTGMFAAFKEEFDKASKGE